MSYSFTIHTLFWLHYLNENTLNATFDDFTKNRESLFEAIQFQRSIHTCRC